MKNSILLVALSLSAVSARTTFRRLLANNAEMLSASMPGDDQPDMTCLISQAMDALSCESFSDSSGACVWCPIGDQFGACVSSDIANVVNDADVPHLKCGQSPSTEDVKFWGDFEICDIEGVTEANCLATNPPESNGCSWCVVDQMGVKFGICLSADYKEALFDLDDVGYMQMFLQCTEDPMDTALEAGSLTDMTCVINGNADPDAFGETKDTKELCAGEFDSEKRPCQVVTVMDFVDICMTDTQANLFNFLMATADSMGMGPDAIASGMAGDGIPGLGGGSAAGGMDMGGWTTKQISEDEDSSNEYVGIYKEPKTVDTMNTYGSSSTSNSNYYPPVDNSYGKYSYGGGIKEPAVPAESKETYAKYLNEEEQDEEERDEIGN